MYDHKPLPSPQQTPRLLCAHGEYNSGNGNLAFGGWGRGGGKERKGVRPPVYLSVCRSVYYMFVLLHNAPSYLTLSALVRL